MNLNIMWCWYASRMEKLIKQGKTNTEEYKKYRDKIQKINQKFYKKSGKGVG